MAVTQNTRILINVPVMNTTAVSGLTSYSTDLKTQYTVWWDRLYFHTHFFLCKNCKMLFFSG